MKSSFSIRHPLGLGLLSLLTLPVSLLHALLLSSGYTQAHAEPTATTLPPVAVLTSVIPPPTPSVMPAPSASASASSASPRLKPVRPNAHRSPPKPSTAASATPTISAAVPLSAASVVVAATPTVALAHPSEPVAVSSTAAAPPEPSPSVVIYPTHIPPPQRVRFKWHRGFLSGDAALDWQHDGQHYEMSIQVDAVLIGSVMVQSSRGRFDSAGLAPERHTDRRRGVSERALSVQRNTTPAQLSFSSKTEVLPFAPGSQDKLSWMVQTAAILEARAAGHGGRSAQSNAVDLVVAGVSGSVESWHIRTEPAEGLVRLVRPPSTPFETRTDIWLDPAQHHMPVRIRLTDPGGDPLELRQITED
ncbi:MAG: hypothetical protein AB3X36_07850 [Leptothrix ochracea]|uniref:hypothetical protein n=1 Tax=Leptothrix ochracea TaxID=735331 RepID=UPI0034E1C7C6